MRMLSTLFGKAIVLGLWVLRRKGTALPGLIIEKMNPGYLAAMLDQLPCGVIIITGTNGKTTTTKIITALLRAEGLRVLTNPTGSNFVRGIVADIARHATLTGRLPYDIGVFEQDEAHAVHFARRYRPSGVVALNVMRDQMDRFGEIDTTARLIGKLVERAKDWVVLNANDRRVAGLVELSSAKQNVWFGHSKALQPLFLDDDQLYTKKPVYFAAAEPAVCLTDIGDAGLKLDIQGKAHTVSTPLTGTHNAINVVAALTALLAAVPEADTQTALDALARIQPAFGRGEQVALPGGGTIRLQLVKNPGGFRHTLRLLGGGHSYDAVGIAINDEYADGRDVSWLWDVDFTQLVGHEHTPTITGGTRAADMALRLKYDGVLASSIEPDLASFLHRFTGSDGAQRSIIFCTYTAMLSLRKLLQRHNHQLRKEGL